MAINGNMETENKRTQQQSKSLWLYFEQLASAFNDAGKDQRIILKPHISIPWTKQAVHDQIWIPIQKVMFSTDSTTELLKQKQIDQIHAVIAREIGEKHQIEFLPFPSNSFPDETNST